MDDMIDLEPNGATNILPDISYTTPSLRSSQGVAANYTPHDLSVKTKPHAEPFAM